MGGGISLAPIAEDILELDAARAYDPNGLSQRQLTLSKDVLHSIRRRSLTDGGLRRRGSSTTSLKASKFPLIPRYEVPAHVNIFLEKIGINEDGDDKASPLPTASSMNNVQRIASLSNKGLTTSFSAGDVNGMNGSKISGKQDIRGNTNSGKQDVRGNTNSGKQDVRGNVSSGKQEVRGNANNRNNNNDNNQPTNPNQNRTTKLVSHIFECLGALQHLVREYQSDYTTDMTSQNDETQSAHDMNTSSVGHLLHEMVSIYGLCGDTVSALLESVPEAAGVEDNLGRLPLHVACDRDAPWMDVLEALVEAKPESLNSRDGGGRLPLHVVLDRQVPDINAVRFIVRSNPGAVSARRGVGRLPLHYACFSDNPDLEVIQCLLDSYPDGVHAVDVYGRLALHYAVDKAYPR